MKKDTLPSPVITFSFPIDKNFGGGVGYDYYSRPPRIYGW